MNPSKALSKLDDIIARLGKFKPIRAYHGSPHSFSRFDASKIGAGEGAQAYGHGLYFAGSEPVADTYRTSVSALKRTPLEDAMEFWRRHAEISGNKQKAVLDALDHAEGSLDEAAGIPEAEQRWKDIIQHLYELDFRQPLPKRPGHMYEVDIALPEELFLDWDAAIPDQNMAVQGVFGNVRGELRWPDTKAKYLDGHADSASAIRWHRAGMESRHAKGMDLWHALRALDDSEGAAKFLVDRGIPGVRYLDQGSRAAGEGTRNYVVFPGAEDAITILRKYGFLPPAAAAAAMSGEEQ